MPAACLAISARAASCAADVVTDRRSQSIACAAITAACAPSPHRTTPARSSNERRHYRGLERCGCTGQPQRMSLVICIHAHRLFLLFAFFFYSLRRRLQCTPFPKPLCLLPLSYSSCIIGSPARGWLLHPCRPAVFWFMRAPGPTLQAHCRPLASPPSQPSQTAPAIGGLLAHAVPQRNVL